MQPVVSIPAPPRSRQLGEVQCQEPLRRGASPRRTLLDPPGATGERCR